MYIVYKHTNKISSDETREKMKQSWIKRKERMEINNVK